MSIHNKQTCLWKEESFIGTLLISKLHLKKQTNKQKIPQLVKNELRDDIPNVAFKFQVVLNPLVHS